MVTLSSLQCQKLERLFNAISNNGGKSVTVADFLEMTQRLAEIRGMRTSDPPYQRMFDVQAAWWDKLRRFAGVDYHGQVSSDQWLGFWSQWVGAIVSEEQFSHRPAFNSLKEAGEVTFDLIDTNADGRVNSGELADWFKAMKNSGDLGEAFAHMDLDRDGYIGRDEGVALVMEFYLSADPESPGNFLLGL